MNGKISNIDSNGRTDGIRARHRAAVMKWVLDRPGIDRTLLSEATGLTNAAMSKIVQELIAAGLVRDTGQLETDGRRGRRRSGLEINNAGGYVLGLSILAFNSSVALTDISGRVVEISQIELSDINNPVTTLDEISNAAIALLKKHKLQPRRVFGAGVAVAGYLDGSGKILDSSLYLGWPVFDLRNSLAKRLGLNVVIDNANRCIAVAENRTGSCKGIEELMLIRAAMGIGGAIISNGEVVRGANNRAGNIGHCCVQPDGLLCTCGATGCLNTLASGWAILNQLGLVSSGGMQTHDLKEQQASLRQVLSPEFAHNSDYQAAIHQAGESLAHHCVGLLQSLAPHSIVLTGPLGRNTTYCDGFRRTLERHNIDIRILAAHQHEISSPAQAASVFALAQHVYTSSFDFQSLTDSAEPDGNASAESIVL